MRLHETSFLALVSSVALGCAHAASTTRAQFDNRLGAPGAFIEGALFSEIPVNVNASTGAFVRYVLPDSSAERVGLMHGDVVTLVDEKVIHDLAEISWMLPAAINAMKCLSLEIKRNGNTFTVPCPIEKRQQAAVDLSRILDVADAAAPVMLLVADMALETRKRLGLRAEQVVDLAGTTLATAIQRFQFTEDTVSKLCLNLIGPSTLPRYGECVRPGALQWDTLGPGRSYKLVVSGVEYRTRQFFDRTPALSLRLVSFFEVLDSAHKRREVTFNVATEGGRDNFFVEIGDRLGSERYEIADLKENCMVLRAGTAKRALCIEPR
jgi:hypothetical protein